MDPAEPPVPPTERPLFEQAMRLHNEGEFYEAHEAWEQIWTNEGNDDWRIFVNRFGIVHDRLRTLIERRWLLPDHPPWSCSSLAHSHWPERR